MHVTRLEGTLLDLWVAKSEGLTVVSQKLDAEHVWVAGEKSEALLDYRPSTDWAQAGPIVSNEWYTIEDTLIRWFGSEWSRVQRIRAAPLLWFMRAYVAVKFGDQVEDLALNFAPARAAAEPTPEHPRAATLKVSGVWQNILSFGRESAARGGSL